MHRNRTWQINPEELRTQRNRILPIEGGDGSTLSLDFTTGILDTRLTFTRSTTGTYINSSGYVTSAAINTPRFDYNPSALTPRGLLIEGQTTNLCIQGQYCWSGNWGRSTDISINSIIGSGGSNPQSRVDGPDGGSGTGTSIYLPTASFQRLSQAVTVEASKQYTYSMWLRPGTNGTTNFRLATFTPASAWMTTVGSCNDSAVTITDVSGGGTKFSNLPDRWVRVSVVFTTDVGQTSVTITAYPNIDTAVPTTNYIWGAQLELGSGASSTILTGASTGTREQDYVTMSDISSLGFDRYQGTFLVRGLQYKAGVSGTYARMLRLVGAQEPLAMPVDGVTLFGSSRNTADAVIAENTKTNTLLQDYAFGWSLDANNASVGMVVALNGSSVGTARLNAGPTAVATSLALNSNAASNAYASMAIKSIKFWPTAKSVSEMATLTTG